MKINFLLPHYGIKPSGGFKVVYQYAYFLAEQGFKINIIHPASMNKFPKKYFKYINMNIIKYRNKFDWKVKHNNINKIYCPSLEEQYIPNADICFATAWQTAWYLNKYDKFKGKKLYLIQHYETWNGSQEQVDKTWRYNMFKIVISKWLLDKAESMGVKDVFYLPNGLNHKKFKIYNDINNRNSIISMMYSSVDWKGSKDGIEAIKIVKRYYPEIQVKLFGKEKRPDNIPEWIDYYENPKEEIIIKDIYNKSSIFLCTSWFEGWGLPPMEAMSCGCAVITTDNGGINDFVINNYSGIICDIKNPIIMAEKIKYLLENDSLRKQLAINGSKKVAEFTWEKSNNKLLNLIKNL